ncbi:MAG: alpha/beta fold hydrolase, partial [Clostridia bacterium]
MLIGKDPWALPGTLTVPTAATGKMPAVVLVHGSGPNDRNESVGGTAIFRDLAHALASRGIAVLRYDKRTLVHGAQFTPEIINGLTVEQETIEDALSAIAQLRADSRIDPARVFLVGHSMGAMLAPRIDAEGGNLTGLVLMAGT